MATKTVVKGTVFEKKASIPNIATPTADAAQKWLDGIRNQGNQLKGDTWDNPTSEYIKNVIWHLQRNKNQTLTINGENCQRNDVIAWIKKTVELNPKISNLLKLNDKYNLENEEEFIENVVKAIELIEMGEMEKGLNKETLDELVKVNEEHKASAKDKAGSSKILTAANISLKDQLRIIAIYQSQNVVPLENEIYGIVASDPHFSIKGVEPIVSAAIHEEVERCLAIYGRLLANGQKLSDAEFNQVFRSFTYSKTASLLSTQAIAQLKVRIRVLAQDQHLGELYKAESAVNPTFEQIVKDYEEKYGLSKAEAKKAALATSEALLKGESVDRAYQDGFTSVGKNTLGEYFKAKSEVVAHDTSFDQVVNIFEKYGLSKSEALKAASIAGQEIGKGSDATSAYVNALMSTKGINYTEASKIIIAKETFQTHQEHLQKLRDRNNFGDAIFIDGKRLTLNEFTINGQRVEFSTLHQIANEYSLKNGGRIIDNNELRELILNNYRGKSNEKATELREIRKGLASNDFENGQYNSLFGQDRIVDYDQPGQMESWGKENNVSYSLGEEQPSFGEKFGNTMQNWSQQDGIKGGVGKAFSGIGKGLGLDGFKMPSLDIGSGLLNKVGAEKLAGFIPAVNQINHFKKGLAVIGAGALAGMGIVGMFIKKGILAGSFSLAGGLAGGIASALHFGPILTGVLAPFLGPLAPIIAFPVSFLGGFIPASIGFGVLGWNLDKIFGTGAKASTIASSAGTTLANASTAASAATSTIVSQVGGEVIAIAQTAVYGTLAVTAISYVYFTSILNSAFSLPPFDKYEQYIDDFKGEFGCPNPIPNGFPKIKPVEGTITQGVNGSFSHEGYNAIDIGGNNGATVKAGHDGQIVGVVFSNSRTGYGNHIRIAGKATDSAGVERAYVTIYAHLSAILVTVGQSVTEGQAIGTVDETGNSRGAHLHYELQTYDPILSLIAIDCLLK